MWVTFGKARQILISLNPSGWAWQPLAQTHTQARQGPDPTQPSRPGSPRPGPGQAQAWPKPLGQDPTQIFRPGLSSPGSCPGPDWARPNPTLQATGLGWARPSQTLQARPDSPWPRLGLALPRFLWTISFFWTSPKPNQVSLDFSIFVLVTNPN